MDERQTKIVEGAGLEESRINQELIEFLNKWSFPVLLVIALISGGYFVKNWFEQKAILKRDEAFAQLGALEALPSPSVFSLAEIAEQYQGAGSVAELARLKAADVHMHAARTGVDPADPAVTLSEADRDFHLEKAEGFYRAVLDATAADDARALLAANAAFGLAAAAETRGDSDTARTNYEKARGYAETAGYLPLARVAQGMLDSIHAGDAPVLYEASALPRLPYQPEPTPPPAPEQPAGPDAPESVDGGEPAPAADLPAPAEAPQPETPATDTPADPPGNG